jgi:Spy/CpxP family protein refolding chaperone
MMSEIQRQNSKKGRYSKVKKISILAAFLILGVLVSVVMAGPRGKFVGPGSRWEMRPSPLSSLNLTEEQSEKTKGLSEALKNDIAPLRVEMIKKRMEIRLLWMQPNPDADSIKAKQKEIRVLRGQMGDKLTDFRLAIRNILTPEQRSQLLAERFGKGRFSRPGQGPRPHDRTGPGPRAHGRMGPGARW